MSLRLLRRVIVLLVVSFRATSIDGTF